MGCTHRFLNFKWEHHTWKPQVTGAEDVATEETDMWGRRWNTHFVRCHKHQVCSACGKTRREIGCICDAEKGGQCAIRLEFLEEESRPRT